MSEKLLGVTCPRVPHGKRGLGYNKGKDNGMFGKKVNHSGSNNPHWKGGLSIETSRIKKQIEFRLWRDAVFARDQLDLSRVWETRWAVECTSCQRLCSISRVKVCNR